MSLAEWKQRYRAGEQVFETPAPLVQDFAAKLNPGRALDLACGPGRNALYLAERGWQVTAVDGSPIAIDLLREQARRKQLQIDAHVADLERGGFELEPAAYDLVVDSYYLQRDLIPAMERGLRPGGCLIMIVHLADPDQPEGTPTRAIPAELRSYFKGWTILHYFEGLPRESYHKRAVAEIVAMKPPEE
ncbi:MAG TPA: methyltransferase domain-containing protein [Bryobacteraceae bacterium]|nr:methyltransferase domain-containing protein [Bryobacteraceae bacterium]